MRQIYRKFYYIYRSKLCAANKVNRTHGGVVVKRLLYGSISVVFVHLVFGEFIDDFFEMLHEWSLSAANNDK